jgi:hypothetical protein
MTGLPVGIVDRNCRGVEFKKARKTRSSCPDLIRASINLDKKFFSKKMDHRVKPGDDDRNWYD